MALRACIIGCGSLGLYFGHRLSTSGAQVTLVERAPSLFVQSSVGGKSFSRRQKIRLREKKLEAFAFAETEVTVTEGLRGLSKSSQALEHPFGIILVTVKHKDTKEVGKQIRDGFNCGIFSRNTAIVSLQNGMGNVELLKEELEGESGMMPIFQGLTYTGVSRREAYVAEINGVGETYIGVLTLEDTYDKSLPDVLKDFANRLGISLTNEIDSMMWTKLLVNTIINPITALINLPNEAIVTEKRFQGVVRLACKEFETVARKEKINLKVGNETAPEFVARVATNTKYNISSMLNDLRQGNETEVEALNGYLVRRARHHGIDVPVQASLYHLVKAMESTASLSSSIR